MLDLKVPGHSTSPSYSFCGPHTLSGNNLQVHSQRIPAGIYISVNINSKRCWKTAIKVSSSHKYVVWGDIVTL
ncbi:hypothetical protein BDR03DRAFT_967068 [Suillus americanus]|nr:hypothetical protein BDR03DRAFT_967068 [Suillus americanus]